MLSRGSSGTEPYPLKVVDDIELVESYLQLLKVYNLSRSYRYGGPQVVAGWSLPPLRGCLRYLWIHRARYRSAISCWMNNTDGIR